ncbi:hypothetical protein F4777DRAFT_590070 [Nemania sp. FL0916]|nr:hypothetical protein F4777DRAFT_590070 [Nemania sp. FL0916]
MAGRAIPGLQRLPYELVACIAKDLDIEDVFHWALCCKHFQYLIREDRFCMPVIMKKAPGTLEAQEALETGRFSRALRRVAKRRNAVSQASPYVVGIVACADSYAFYGGKLCYVIEARPQRWLRILDVHKSTRWELVVNIPALIRAAVPQAAQCRKYKFRVLYQASGIVSCLFSFALPNTENWLLIIRPETHKILGKVPLDSAARIFVRNNNKFLFYGTHSLEGADGLKKWVIRGIDLDSGNPIPQTRLYLSNMGGSDIGSTVCFEIFDNYFYGVSNHTLFEADDPDWTSHYYCFRFPLDEPSEDKLEFMKKEDSWRRTHSEGPIDDRWGFLSLERDESSNKIVIIECRKEWLRDRRGSQRTYYTTDVVFDLNTFGAQQRVRRGTARRLGDHPQCDGPLPVRRPEYVHAGDDSTVASLLVRSKTYFCAYIRGCQAFIDLIDDTATDTSGPQRLRLRTGYRRLKPGVRLIRGDLAMNAMLASTESSNQSSMQPYRANSIFIWPPEPDSLERVHYLDKVRQLLNVDGRENCVTAVGDERSIIYATSDGSPGGVKGLVFIGFDPAVKFLGMEYGGDIRGQRIILGNDAEADDQTGPGSTLQPSPNFVRAGYEIRQRKVDSPVSLQTLDTLSAFSADHPEPCIPPSEDGDPWALYEKPMHMAIRRKLSFVGG